MARPYSQNLIPRQEAAIAHIVTPAATTPAHVGPWRRRVQALGGQLHPSRTCALYWDRETTQAVRLVRAQDGLTRGAHRRRWVHADACTSGVLPLLHHGLPLCGIARTGRLLRRCLRTRSLLGHRLRLLACASTAVRP